MSSKPRKMCKFQGLPPYHLPKWRYMSLENKLPMLKETPDGAINLYIGDGNIGTGPWLKAKNLDFNTWDPLLLRLPTDSEYNALRDPNLKCYFSNPRRLKLLYKQGLITREGKSCATLKDFNKYRSYLHDCSLDAIRVMQRQTLCEDVHNLVVRTVIKSKEDVRIQGDPCKPNQLGLRYSEMLRNEMKGICERSVTEFETTPYFREFCEGERQSLLKLRQVLLNDIRKRALIRLRKLQNYEDTQAKFWKEWIKRSKAQVQDRVDYIMKEKCLNTEKCNHIREFNEYISQKRKIRFDVLTRSRERHNKKLTNLINMARRRVCKKSHRQYPLSAQCPYNFFEGGKFGDTCPYGNLVVQLESDLYCDYPDDDLDHLTYPPPTKGKDAPCPKKTRQQCSTRFSDEEECREELQDEMERTLSEKMEEPSVTDSLIYTIIQNAIALTIKHLHLPQSCPQLNTSSSLKIIRSRYFLRELFNELKDELADLLKNYCERLVYLNQAKISAATKETKKKTSEADNQSNGQERWGNAPLLRSNSRTLTGRYIREQLIRVSTKMKCEGTLTEDKNQTHKAVLDHRFEKAALEASTADDVHYLSCQLIDGVKAVCEAREILDALDPNNELDKDNLVTSLVAALIRTALITIKNSLYCGAVDGDDIVTVSSFINKQQNIKKQQMACKNVQDLIDRYSDDLMKNKCMDVLIKDTMRKIKCTKESGKSDDEIKKHLSKAAKKFVTKVIENLMCDELIKDKKAGKEKMEKKWEVFCEDVKEKAAECDDGDIVLMYDLEDLPTHIENIYQEADEICGGEDVISPYDLPLVIESIDTIANIGGTTIIKESGDINGTAIVGETKDTSVQTIGATEEGESVSGGTIIGEIGGNDGGKIAGGNNVTIETIKTLEEGVICNDTTVDGTTTPGGTAITDRKTTTVTDRGIIDGVITGAEVIDGATVDGSRGGTTTNDGTVGETTKDVGDGTYIGGTSDGATSTEGKTAKVTKITSATKAKVTFHTDRNKFDVPDSILENILPEDETFDEPVA